MFSAADTIVAIATPPGRGGIGVVRLAGPEACVIAVTLAPGVSLAPRHATYTTIQTPGATAVVDQVVMTWFKAPHSYSGDDVVEVSAHGSPAVLDEIVRLACNAGARLAEPGEFTFRAWLNGRLDLVQAEAVADLINAVTPTQARVAMDQLEGTLTSKIRDLDAAIFDLSARLEASLDFPDEGFHFVTREEAREALYQAKVFLDGLIADGRQGRVIREGRSVVIAGRPNVGKSSLFNALVQTQRAIVTPLAGTTRDLLIETIDVRGIPVTLVDTAGLRESGDVVEAEGVRRAREAMSAAALTLVVCDQASALTDEDQAILSTTTGPTLVIANKCDLPAAWEPDGVTAGAIRTSTVSGTGIGALRDAIAAALLGGDELRDRPAISNIRHLQCAEQAESSIDRALATLDAGGAEELVLAELVDARRACEALTGARTPDDVLAHVFAHFCVGK